LTINEFCKIYTLDFLEKNSFKDSKLKHLKHLYELTEELLFDVLLPYTLEIYKEKLSIYDVDQLHLLLNQIEQNDREILLNALFRFLCRFLRRIRNVSDVLISYLLLSPEMEPLWDEINFEKWELILIPISHINLSKAYCTCFYIRNWIQK